MARILTANDEEASVNSARVDSAHSDGAELDRKHLVETKRREELVQRARKAAQRAVHEPDPEPQTKRNESGDSWRNMWIAFAIIVAILSCLRLLSY